MLKVHYFTSTVFDIYFGNIWQINPINIIKLQDGKQSMWNIIICSICDFYSNKVSKFEDIFWVRYTEKQTQANKETKQNKAKQKQTKQNKSKQKQNKTTQN